MGLLAIRTQCSVSYRLTIYLLQHTSTHLGREAPLKQAIF